VISINAKPACNTMHASCSQCQVQVGCLDALCLHLHVAGTAAATHLIQHMHMQAAPHSPVVHTDESALDLLLLQLKFSNQC